MNAILPGAGIAVEGLSQAKNMKKAAKVMGKEAAKEGVQMLDNSKEEKHPMEELSEDAALEILSHVGGRG